MRTLIISQHLPGISDTHGVFQRLQTFAQALDKIGTLDFLFFVGPHKKTTAEETSTLLTNIWRIKKPNVFIERYGDDPGMRNFISGYLTPTTSIHCQAGYARMSGPNQVTIIERYISHKPDLILAHRLSNMCPLMQTNTQTPPILFDLDDIEHKAMARSISKPPTWGLKPLQYLQIPALWLGERAAIRKSSTTFVCSEKDKAYLHRTMGVNNVTVLPNTSAMPDKISTASSAPPNILFIGSYSYPPNALAANILIRDIWPIIKIHVPHAKLLIAGASPERISSHQSAIEDVEYTGFVDDLHGLYDRTRLVCTPIKNGGGTRIKIIEAAMHARPVVSTVIGAEGLEFKSGEEIIIENKTENIAQACIELLINPGRCDTIGEAAILAAKRRYGRESAIETIVDTATALVNSYESN